MKKVAIVVIAILLVITSGIGVYGLTYQYFSKQNTADNSSKVIQIIPTNNTSSSEETNETELGEIGCNLYEEELKSYLTTDNNMEKILEYKISSCGYVEPPVEVKDNYEVSEDSFYIEIKYDVKPYDITNTIWDTGNGIIGEEWITNKSNRSNIKKENEIYVKKNSFTGW